MNEDIEKLKDKLKKKLENYELDKKIGQLSVDSIYSLFPNESITLLDYIEQLQKQNVELKERYNNMFEYHCNRVQVEKEKIKKQIKKLARTKLATKSRYMVC